MIIIAFSTHTSKIVPQILCRRFRHVAVILPTHGTQSGLVMKQFIRPGHIADIPLRPRDITILGRNGWRFVYVPGTQTPNMSHAKSLTCVAYAKHILGLHKMRIQTPDALYKYLTR